MPISLKNIIKFSLILLLGFLCLLEGFLWLNQESIPYSLAYKKQESQHLKYAPRYFDVTPAYKIIGAQHYKPDMLILGTSRMLQFKDEHFPKIKVYNAATASSVLDGLDGIQTIIKSSHSHHPIQTVVIGMDPFFFNPNFPPHLPSRKNTFLKQIRKYTFTNSLYTVYSFIKTRQNAYQLLFSENNDTFFKIFFDSRFKGFGLNAKIHNSGYRLDGSFKYPTDHASIPTTPIHEWESEFQRNRYNYAPAENLDPDQVQILRTIIDFCEQNNIEVILYLPPMRSDLWTAFESFEPQKTYFNQMTEMLKTEAENSQATFIDLTNPNILNLNDKDFYDSIHTKEHAFNIMANEISKVMKK